MPYGTVNADVIQTSTSGGILGAGNASIMKNRIINGAMVVAQRGTSLTNPNGYTLDRWFVATGVASTVIQQSTTVPTGGGFSYSLYYNQGASTWTPTGTQWNSIAQSIEGYNVADLMYGTANAKTVTLSFWVYASLTGTYSVALNNASTTDIGSATVTRSYVTTFTVSSANTWQQVSITVAGDTSGTWLTTNGAGLTVVFGLGNASGYNTSTTNAWQAGKYLQTSGSVSLATNANSTFYITGVQLEVGSSATGFEYRQYGQELALCQRYCVIIPTTTQYMGAHAFSTNRVISAAFYPATMRATPTVTSLTTAYTYFSNGGAWTSSASGTTANSSGNISIDVTVTATSGSNGVIAIGSPITLSAEL